MMFKSYQLKYGATEEQLGAVALTFRKHASLNDNAVMQTPITLDDYLHSRYVVRPLHLLDLCLVNDGGACIILQRADMAKDRGQVPVFIDGLGNFAGGRDGLQLRPLVEDHLKDYVGGAGEAAFRMAGLQTSDIDMVQAYDAGSALVPVFLEGLGFCKPGEGIEFIQDGRIGLGGKLPMNTDGGQLSACYLQGWSQVVECVRQLRGQAGKRQVPGARTALCCNGGGIGSHVSIFRRGEH
jgi:acetyl-CoA acetyltransferase